MIIKDTGGDGIYINNEGGVAKNYQVVDVTSDGAYRNGITIVSADSVLIRRSTFRNSSGPLPGSPTTIFEASGIDIEPNGVSGETLSRIIVIECKFNSNWLDGIHSYLKKYYNSSIQVSFYRCRVDSNGQRGISFNTLLSTGPSTGTIYFENDTATYSHNENLYISGWRYDKAQILINDCSFSYAAPGLISTRPIKFTHAGGDGVRVGNIKFEGTNTIVDNVPGRPGIINSPVGTHLENITNIGTLDITRHNKYGSVLNFETPDTINVNLPYVDHLIVL